MNIIPPSRVIALALALVMTGGAGLRAELVGEKIYAEADAAKLAASVALTKKEPANYRAWLRLAGRYAALGKIAEAESAYGGALAASPESLEPYHAMALMYLGAARYDDAARVSSAWLAKDPGSYYGHFCLADALSLRGDVKKSLGTLLELNKRYPSDTAVLFALKLRYDHLGMTGEAAGVSKLLAEIKAEGKSF